MKPVAVIGVPSSAGAHSPGQEKAPAALRKAGLIAELRQRGVSVADLGDVPRERFTPDPLHRRAQNAVSVARVARRTAELVRKALAAGALPLVLGGDCSIGIGVMSAVVAHRADASLLYFDGHADLNTPLDSTSGILDSMGLAHMLGEEGCLRDLLDVSARRPLLTPDRVALFGYNPREMNHAELSLVEELPLARYPLDVVRANPTRAAAEAVQRLESTTSFFAVHFDIDVVEFSDLPLADYPQLSEALPFDAASVALQIFASSPAFGALTITELNPDHGDAAGDAVRRVVRSLATALALAPC